MEIATVRGSDRGARSSAKKWITRTRSSFGNMNSYQNKRVRIEKLFLESGKKFSNCTYKEILGFLLDHKGKTDDVSLA